MKRHHGVQKVLGLPDKFWDDAPPRFNEGIEDCPGVAFGKRGRHRGEEGEEDGEDKQVVCLPHLADALDSCARLALTG